MELIGVPHLEKILRDVIFYLREVYLEGIESLMVELPPNWPELSSLGFHDGFFGELANVYQRNGTKIIYGDRARNIPKLHRFWNYIGRHFNGARYAIEEFTIHKGSKGMIDAIKEEKPEVVVVGRSHADYIKRAIPEAYYTVFEFYPVRLAADRMIILN